MRWRSRTPGARPRASEPGDWEAILVSSFGSRNERHSITSRFRLRGYDYSLPGYYFITICIANRSPLLGVVQDGEFTSTPAGEMVLQVWGEQATRFPDIELDEFCVMPNHFHALIGIGTREGDEVRRTPLPEVVQGFKAATTVAYGRGVRTPAWPRFDGRLWQKGYHDHIVRSDHDLERIRDYIVANPSSWERDAFYSHDTGK
jgi:putative transposase